MFKRIMHRYSQDTAECLSRICIATVKTLLISERNMRRYSQDTAEFLGGIYVVIVKTLLAEYASLQSRNC